jgi:hypothetical protein
MSKVILFSRLFPGYHPRVGQETFFVEKFWNSIHVDFDFKAPVMSMLGIKKISINTGAKYHTIRLGNRFKPGDKFSPRVWSGIPYRSKQIIIAPDVEVKQIWDFEMDLNGVYSINNKYIDPEQYLSLANNDGLTEYDLFHWFMKDYHIPNDFSGQIICWNPNIKY